MSISGQNDVQSVRNSMEIINRVKNKEDKVMKKPELVKLSVENFHQK